MKTRVPIRLGSFQSRLLLYLLLVGSIPLLCAILVFYRQAGTYAQKELAAYVQQSHEQMLLALKRALNEIDHTARNMANDYAVQRYLDLAGTRDPEERGLKDYIDASLRQQMNQAKFIADWCVASHVAGYAICTNESGLQGYLLASDGAAMLKKSERLLESADAGGRADLTNIVKMTIPVYDRRTSAVKGTVVAAINLSRVLAESQSRWPLDNHLLYDAKGSVFYQMKPARAEESQVDLRRTEPYVLFRESEIVSQKKLSLDETEWISAVTVKDGFSTSAFRGLRDTLIAIFAVLVVLSLMSSIIFSRYITKPLGHLRGLMKRAELGDLKAYWVARGTQEMNDLGESYNQMLNRVEELIKQVKREEALKKEAEIEALQYQLNPHFLYNTLNTIKWVAKLHKTPQISEVVSALVRLLQASLGKKGDFLEIREEIGLIKDYMEIQNFRYGDKVKLVYDIDPFAARCLVPRMILQPLVENAIIHGIEPSGRDGLITIRAWIERDILFCQVEDNGVGIQQESGGLTEARELKERMSGIGMRHIREKIKLYYGDDYKMYVTSKERQGTTVRLTLPIHRNEG
ncbi:sensor histidine kinase [Paenibacillus hamazuiensis]|uniref:sensor histidine kinase n=1 Tax=Paenibacillus hamazuiensis TaxID=2936508 RepID=UPI00200EDB27|nr:sensor histidine kinase [Paenibacillus hamazuiensis]